ncbi:hypothetical protein ASE73_08460 [Sphingomonas sp. Leaf24]|nr:hypothetical protein ASE50_06500 [Sphingomonas sp. Leaf5]KQM89059.1 hypothetical protein ASE73_08460 [Sphingomonas sp. Leaf24]
MSDVMLLPLRQAKLCRVFGVVFLLAAMVMPFVIVTAGLTPGANPYCGGGKGCVWKAQPSLLLDEETRLQVAATATTQRRFESYAARPDIRIGLALVDAVDSVPFGMMMFSVGLALRRLGGPVQDALLQALRWLRRASAAAILWSLAQPVYETLLTILLSPGTPAWPMVAPSIYLASIATGLLLALAAYATIWALEATLRAQRDLAEFV